MRIIRQHNKKQDIQAVEVEPGDEGLLQEVEGGDEGLLQEVGDEGLGQQGLDEGSLEEAGDEEGDEGGPNLQQAPIPVDGEHRLFPLLAVGGTVAPTVGDGFHFCVMSSGGHMINLILYVTHLMPSVSKMVCRDHGEIL